MFDGLMSGPEGERQLSFSSDDVEFTSVDNAVDVVQVCQAFQYSPTYLTNDVDRNRTMLLIYTIETASVHAFHADADMRVRYESTIE